MEVKFFELRSAWVRESHEALAEVDRAFENELAEIREGFEEGDQFILLFRFTGVSNKSEAWMSSSSMSARLEGS